MNNKDIYEICKSIRKYGIVAGVVVIAFGFLLYSVLLNGELEDLFYGINRVYLIFPIMGIALIVYHVFGLLFNVDKRKIKYLAENQGIMMHQFEMDLRRGNVFYQKGSGDVLCISDQYGLIRSKGAYHVIRTKDIMKLGIDTVNVGQTTQERMNCLMRDGSVYPLIMKHSIAMQAASFLTNISQNV